MAEADELVTSIVIWNGAIGKAEDGRLIISDEGLALIFPAPAAQIYEDAEARRFLWRHQERE